MSDSDGVNRDFEPTSDIETVLNEFKAGRDSGEPWGRVNPMYLREHADLEKSTVEYALRRLDDAGWIDRVAEGLYEFRGDPRED